MNHLNRQNSACITGIGSAALIFRTVWSYLNDVCNASKPYLPVFLLSHFFVTFGEIDSMFQKSLQIFILLLA